MRHHIRYNGETDDMFSKSHEGGKQGAASQPLPAKVSDRQQSQQAETVMSWGSAKSELLDFYHSLTAVVRRGPAGPCDSIRHLRKKLDVAMWVR